VKVGLLLSCIWPLVLCAVSCSAAQCAGSRVPTLAPPRLHKVQSHHYRDEEPFLFDNYFGALAYSPEARANTIRSWGCSEQDHVVSTALSCRMGSVGSLNLPELKPGRQGSSSPSRFTMSAAVIFPDLPHFLAIRSLS